MAKKKPAILELPVSWGGLSIGDETCRLGASVSRGNLTATQADRNLCGRRLTGRIISRAGNGQAGQASLPGANGDAEVEGVFDVKGVGLGTRNINFGLTFILASIDVETIAHFPKSEGVLIVNNVEAIPDDDDDDDDDGDDEE
jgi:hypothetical protein